jgi:hypothetical protein
MLSNEQQQFLNDNRPHYETLVRADFLTNIGYDVKNGLLNIARVFDPGYQANLWCGPCVCDLVKYAYTQYDKWLLEQPHKATFPKHDEPEEDDGSKVFKNPVSYSITAAHELNNPVKRTYKRKK